MLRLERSAKPWTGASCMRLENARGELATRCGGAAATILPERIEVLFDVSIEPNGAKAFLESVAAQLARETTIWQRRLDELVEAKLATPPILNNTCKALRRAQTWYILETAAGGLTAGAPLLTAGNPETEQRGVIPCSAATHHGVAWWPGEGGRGVGLVTSRRVSGSWNWDEDIGHEAAHASFGPVPLYSQTLESDGFKTPLAQAYAAAGGILTEVLVARTCYLISEIIVAFVRGEQRTTGSGLPGLHSAADFEAFCALAQTIAPEAGFDACARAGADEGFPLAVWSGPTIRRLGAAAFNSVAAIIPQVNATRPPALQDFHRSMTAA